MQKWDTVAIVGVGLIGGSVGLAINRRSLARRVIGIGRNPTNLEQAKTLSAITETTTDLESGVAQAEVIVVCTPVAEIPSFVARCAKHCSATCLITDVGSIKAGIVAAIEQWSPDAPFVAAHPMAGSEKTGVSFAREDLFDDQPVLVTPTQSTPPARIEQIEQFWEALGGNVFRMPPDDHDRVVATISHLPHVAASALAASTPEASLSLVGAGWRDTTRIAGGDVELWRQILTANRQRVLESIELYANQLSRFRAALAENDEHELTQLLEAGRTKRATLGD